MVKLKSVMVNQPAEPVGRRLAGRMFQSGFQAVTGSRATVRTGAVRSASFGGSNEETT